MRTKADILEGRAHLVSTLFMGKEPVQMDYIWSDGERTFLSTGQVAEDSVWSTKLLREI